MKMLYVLLFLTAPVFAQYQPVPATNYPALENILNAKTVLTYGGGSPSGSCTTGKDIYVNTLTNQLFWCSATNTWTSNAGSGGGSSAVKVDGTSIGTVTGAFDFRSSGASVAAVVNGADVDITISPDNAIYPNRADVQAGADTYCVPTSGSSTAYTCTLSKPLTVYTEGMRLLWSPDVSCGAAPTLNVNANGGKRIYQTDGVSNPTPGQCSAGTQLLVSYTGSLNSGAGGWRILSGEATSLTLTPGALPTCASNIAGKFWYVQGNSSTKDTVQVCAHDASNTFAWRTIY